MSRMGMLKTAISGRFGLGGQVIGGDIPTDIDVGATQPDTPMPSKRSKDKRSKENPSLNQVGPALILRPDKKELKHGHDPNKIGLGMVSKRHIIVEPSNRNMNYQASTRNITVEPSTRNVLMSPQKNMRNTMDKQKATSMRNMNSFDKKSSMRNMGAFDKKSSMRNMGKPDKMIGASPRVANINTLETTKAKETISPPQFIGGGLGSIDENNSRNTNLGIPKVTPKTVTQSSPKVNSAVNQRTAITRTPIMMTSIDEATSSIPSSLPAIDENSPNNQNHNNDTTGRSLSSTNSKNSAASNGRSPMSTSIKSTTSTATTKSTNSTSSKNVENILASTIASPTGDKNSLGNSISSISDKSTRSARSEKTKNADNRTKSRPKPPRKRGPSLVTPAHFNRDRPSTVLITRKEMEDILAEKQREEALEAKTLPPKTGTMSTDLWLDAANREPHSEEFSVASGTSVEEDESPFGKSPKKIELEDEYDINFFDITEEEEITEHTINSGHNSFDASDLHFTESMEQRESTIRFDEYDELQTCLHINDYTNGEITRSWYKRDDYDKMVDLARKTAQKAVKREKELRDELESMLGVSVSPPRAGRKNGELREATTDDDNKSNHSGRSTGTDGKRKKPIEYRGLEAWTPEGSQRCRTLKEKAIELVWNEQSRQWEEGTFDPEAIAKVYIPVAKEALKAAHDRALADQKMVKRLAEQENKKKNRNAFRKSTAVIKKAAKGTSKVGGKVFTGTGKAAVKIGKRSGKALVATATLDSKMMKEAVKVRIHGKKKRECKHELEVTTSKAAVERDIEILEESGSLNLQDSNSSYYSQPLDRRQLMQMQRPRPALPTINDMTVDSVSDDLSSANGGISQDFRDGSYRTGDSESNVSSPKKKSKLKLLGIVPIPGTQKKYSEDRRAEREEKRKEKMTRRPSWEASMASGKH